jgi:DNA ligase D-like protein (predicted polymerase)
MLIRKNTRGFKTILEIVSACQARADREQLIRLFITKAGDTVKDRISVDSIQGDSALFYEMNYQTVLNSLRSPNHQLNESDEVPGLFFFHSSSNKRWDETPFEFDEAVVNEFSELPDLPRVRKREKSGTFVLPTAKTTSRTPAKKTEKKTEKSAAPKVSKRVVQGPKQPDFKLKYKIEFTNLDKIIFRQPQLNKEQILTYYNKISDNLLPYLKDRQQWVRTSPDNSRPLVELTKDLLFRDDEDSVPEWLQTRNAKKGEEHDSLVVNDKEHLLLYVERGALEFHPCHSRTKPSGYPDYIIITIDSPESDIAKAVHVALEAKKIFNGLKLPSFVKTDGLSGLHVYIPLDSKTNFLQSRDSAMFICKLISLKIPDMVTMAGSDGNSYGKVSLDYSLNEEGQTIIAPYSLVAGESVTVATPLLWEEVNDSLRQDAFNPESIFKRLKQVGDPFENLFKKKVNAAELVQMLEQNYGFLF